MVLTLTQMKYQLIIGGRAKIGKVVVAISKVIDVKRNKSLLTKSLADELQWTTTVP